MYSICFLKSECIFVLAILVMRCKKKLKLRWQLACRYMRYDAI